VVSKERYRANPELYRARRRAAYKADPSKVRGYDLKKKYKITLEEYNEMLVKQNGKCAVCFTNKPKGKGGLHVDHDHRTGKVRGLLCHSCNSIAGYADDNIELLEALIAYLKRELPT